MYHLNETCSLLRPLSISTIGGLINGTSLYVVYSYYDNKDIPAAAAAQASEVDGSGVVDSNVGLMAGGCGKGVWVRGDTAELGLDAPDFGR